MAACADTFLSICRLNDGIQFHCDWVSVVHVVHIVLMQDRFWYVVHIVFMHDRFCYFADNKFTKFFICLMAACADTFLSICRLNDGIQFHCDWVSVPFL
jgi:hypothetical protein